MANIGTSLGGLFSSIGTGIAGVGQGILEGVGALSPLIETGLGIFQATQSPRVQAPQVSPVRTGGSLAMPGGAPTMAMISTTGVGAGPTGAGLSALVPALRGVGQALVPGGSPGPVGCIAPMPTRGGMRLPRLVNVPNPNDPSKIETYVRDPRPRYRVSISGPRRRGGR